MEDIMRDGDMSIKELDRQREKEIDNDWNIQRDMDIDKEWDRQQ